MLDTIFNIFREYMGTGLITVWFMLAVIYLFIFEKRKEIRVMFVYLPVLLLILFFNPLFAGFVYSFIGDEIYYRLLWILPVTPVIAYTVCDIYGRLPEKKKIMFAIAAAILIMVSGNFIYADVNFKRAENIYHVPDSVADICDAIEIEGREVTAVFPAELIQYVRQYSGTVCMPYGREQTVDRWNMYNSLYNIMESECPDAQELADEARTQGCIYIVLPEDKKTTGSITDCGYTEYYRADGYVVYKDIYAVM